MMLASIVVFIIVYIAISSEKINKTIVALVGAALFLLFHFIAQESAFEHVDWSVIILLVSMMIIVGITKETGLFQFVAIKAAKLAHGEPLTILILLSLITALFSAFLDNVTTILILTPVTILIAVELGLSPVPFLIPLIIASNIGGMATLIGDPPNIMIGSSAGLSFMDFIVNLAPVAILLMALGVFILFIALRGKLKVSNERRARIMDFDEKQSLQDPVLLVKCLVVLALVIGGFLLHNVLHVEASTIALAGAALLLLLVRPKELHHHLQDVEWETIFFFFGLFVMVGGLVEQGVMKLVAEKLLGFTNGNLQATAVIVLWLSGVFSAVVDNIPFVATMIPLIKSIGESLGPETITPLWWSLALGACLGGNGTLVGASANVVCAGIAGKSGFRISFLEFTKYGALFTLFTLLVSTGYILLRYFVWA